MATLPERKYTTDPRLGMFHVVKAGEGVSEYSYRILWEKILAAIKKDHPIVIGVYGSYANLPTSNVNLGTVAFVRDETRLYIYDTGGWTPGSNGASEVLTIENTTVYDSDEVYGIGNVFVSYVNESSEEELFQSAAIYRSRTVTVKGISPEDSLYDLDTNPTGKWEYQGQSVTLQSGGLATIAAESVTDIMGITDYADGNNIFDISTLFLYRFDSSSTETHDGVTVIKPNDIDSGDAGRWLKIKEFGAGDETFTLAASFSGHDSFKTKIGRNVTFNSVIKDDNITELRVGKNGATPTDIIPKLPLSVLGTDELEFEATYDRYLDSYFTLIGTK